MPPPSPILSTVPPHIHEIDRQAPLHVYVRVSQKDPEMTALMWASLFGHVDVVNTLLMFGANPNAKKMVGDSLVG